VDEPPGCDQERTGHTVVSAFDTRSGDVYCIHVMVGQGCDDRLPAVGTRRQAAATLTVRGVNPQCPRFLARVAATGRSVVAGTRQPGPQGRNRRHSPAWSRLPT
ncbi:MAG: hypothetical protein ACI8XM_002785, partial [Haloarculaceae archaeon]